MTAQVPAPERGPAAGRLDLLGFVVRSLAPNELRMSRSGSWVPLDFAGVLQRLEHAGTEELSPAGRPPGPGRAARRPGPAARTA